MALAGPARLRDFDAERLGRLQVDDELESGRQTVDQRQLFYLSHLEEPIPADHLNGTKCRYLCRYLSISY